MEPAIYDLKQFFRLHEAIETLDVAAPPTARVLSPEVLPPCRQVGILCGSFNPLTLAHTELAERTCATFGLDHVLFTLAKVTVDKEQVTGLGLADRLLLLTLYAQRHEHIGVALVNRGLYVDQAQAFRSLLGPQVELQFVVGMDKLVQILDPRYYQDREAALRQLFALASLVVANRGDMAKEEFNRLLDQPENRAYRSYVRFCPLSAAFTDLSATAVRHALAAGESVNAQVPEETTEFLSETHAFAPPCQYSEEAVDAYVVRQHLLTLLTSVRSWAEKEVDFRHLVQVALSADAKGRALRMASTATELVAAIRSL